MWVFSNGAGLVTLGHSSRAQKDQIKPIKTCHKHLHYNPKCDMCVEALHPAESKEKVGQVWKNANSGEEYDITRICQTSTYGGLYCWGIKRGTNTEVFCGPLTLAGYADGWMSGWFLVSGDNDSTPQRETECRVRSCRRRNYTDAKSCWNCGITGPTQNQPIIPPKE